jgi:hypothetical protein
MKHQSASTKERKESERFAVAALAFFLEYDPMFREEFLEAIGAGPLSEEQCKKVRIFVEPKRQADLLLTLDSSFAAAIEFKIGSKLGSIQHPNHKFFDKDARSYGKWLVANYSSKGVRRLIYTVLDQLPWTPHDQSHSIDSHTIELHHVEWKALKSLRASNITLRNDFFSLLETLGVKTMNTTRAHQHRITESLQKACEAGDVIDAVLEELEFDRKKISVENITKENEEWEFGAYIFKLRGEAQKRNAFQRKLSKVCDAPDMISWFGFLGKGSDKAPTATVYLYTSSAKRSTTLKTLLQRKLKGTSITKEEDVDSPGVIVSKSSTDKSFDFQWFKTVLEGAVKAKY